MLKLILLSSLLALGHCQFFGGLPKVPGASSVPNPINAARGAANKASDALNSLLEQQWGDFNTLYKKTYATAEEKLLRKNIFVDHGKKILEFNKQVGNSFVQKVNGFADLLSEEFNKFYNGFSGKNRDKIPPGEKFVKEGNQLPKSVDWKQKGGVTSVKNQNLCAACYAFAAAGAMEGQHFRKTGKLVEVSPQNFIDCTKDLGNFGCSGGLTNTAYLYAKENKGVNTETVYPYEAKAQDCRDKNKKVLPNSGGYVDIPEGDEKALEEAVAKYGPVSAAIDASLDSFQFYSDGIYNDPKCKNTIDSLNHAVLVVGYGEENGKKYWLVKNSYGPEWGKDGYVKIAKDAGNQCGIATYASYPVV